MDIKLAYGEVTGIWCEGKVGREGKGRERKVDWEGKGREGKGREEKRTGGGVGIYVPKPFHTLDVFPVRLHCNALRVLDPHSD